jgi:hypothetical protein
MLPGQQPPSILITTPDSSGADTMGATSSAMTAKIA